MPIYNKFIRPEAEKTANIRSHVTTTTFIPSRKSMTDPMTLAKESQEVRDAIIAKSKRLAPLYSKGPVQLMTEGTDYKTVGRKI
jgi:hypothetical protein